MHVVALHIAITSDLLSAAVSGCAMLFLCSISSAFHFVRVPARNKSEICIPTYLLSSFDLI